MDTEQLSETLTKLNTSLDPKSVSKKSNSETLLQLEVQENSASHYYTGRCTSLWEEGDGGMIVEKRRKEERGRKGTRLKCQIL